MNKKHRNAGASPSAETFSSSITKSAFPRPALPPPKRIKGPPSVPTIPPSFPVCKSGPAKTFIFLSQSAASSADHLPVTPREDHWRRERKETSVPASGLFPIRRSSRTVPQEYAGPLSSPGKESGRRAIPEPPNVQIHSKAP